MAAEKKVSEGIKLLSVYNDDEDDDMEDAEDEEEGEDDDPAVPAAEERERQPSERGEAAAAAAAAEEEDRSERAAEEGDDPGEASDGEDGGARVGSEGAAGAAAAAAAATASDSGHESTPQPATGSSTPGQREQPATHPQQEAAVSVEARRMRRRRREMLSIVDYAHDEVAMSPEAEEGEIDSSSDFMLDERFQTANGDYQEKPTQETVQVLSPNNQDISISSGHIEPSQPDVRNVTEAQPIEIEDSTKISDDIDSLDKFLPSPPTDKCSEELQERVRKFIAYKRAGKSFNAEVRNRKDYRNPDFLLHSVRYQDIDQIGSCFNKEVFDPHGYDPSDYYDELEVDMKRETERKEQERKKSQQVEFVSSGVQAGAPAILPKVNVPVAGVPTATSGGLRPSDPAARDGRQNKKSKWDKVDGDRKKPSGAQESVSTVAAHAAILSAANAGAGYTAFAQQRRREAEERRSGEKKLDRRS
ncbi:hypothetical protein NL676_008375 [Syzygium grande]|nr:hypothetical protein NL676_008375 [Syzygium grande]